MAWDDLRFEYTERERRPEAAPEEVPQAHAAEDRTDGEEAEQAALPPGDDRPDDSPGEAEAAGHPETPVKKKSRRRSRHRRKKPGDRHNGSQAEGSAENGDHSEDSGSGTAETVAGNGDIPNLADADDDILIF